MADTVTALSLGAIVCENPKSHAKSYSYWKIFFPDCRHKFFLCNSGAGAFVAAITMCQQGLK